MRHLWIISIMLTASAFSAAPVFAQTANLPLALSLASSPTSPAPGQSVTVRAYTPTLDTATTFFDWSVNGAHKKDASGYGNNSIQVTAGDIGTSVRVDVVATGAAGQPGKSFLIIRPSTVALSWYAQTYAPAWYKGKALPTPNSVVTVVATPRMVLDGITLKPESMVYTWGFENRDRVLVGVGKQTFSVQMSDQTDVDQQVRVRVEDMDGRISAERSIFLTTIRPRAAIYRITPLGGTESRMTASFAGALQRGTIDLIAEPFFFPTLSKKDMAFQWTIGGLSPGGKPQNPFITTIEASDPNLNNLSVSAQISMPQPDNLIARAVASMLLLFR